MATSGRDRSCENELDAIVDTAGGTVWLPATLPGGRRTGRKARWPDGLVIHLAHPGYVSRMRQNPDKHDWGDARMLADRRVGYLPRVWLCRRPSASCVAWSLLPPAARTRHRNILELQIGALLREERRDSSSGLGLDAKVEGVAGSDGTSPAEPLDHRASIGAADDGAERHQGRRRPAHELDAGRPAGGLADKGIGPVTAWMLRRTSDDSIHFARAKHGFAG